MKMIKSTISKVFNRLEPYFSKSKEDSLSAYAAQTTFFILLSFFPFVFLVFMISKNITSLWDKVLAYILKVVPEGMDRYVMYIVNDLLYSGKRTITIVTLILALWSSAKGVQALSYGLDKIYCVERKKNFITTRLFSILYTFVFLLLGFAVMMTDILGDRIINAVIEKNNSISEWTLVIMSLRMLFAFIFLFAFILIIYCKLPARKGHIKDEIWGAALAAISWIVMTRILSWYIKYISNMSYMYGGFSSIIVFVIWLYIGIQIILYGGVFNYYRKHS